MKPFQTSYATSATLMRKMLGDPSEEDWERFFNIYRPIILYFAQCRGLRPQDAENILQRTMIVLMRKFSPDESGRSFNYDPEKGSFRGYLGKIVSNMAKKEYARAARRPFQADTWQINKLGASGRSEVEAMSDEQLLNLAVLRAALQRVRAYYAERSSNSFEIFHDIVFRKIPTKDLEKRYATNRNNLYQTKNRVKQRIEKTCQSLLAEDFDGLERLDESDVAFDW